MRDWLAVKSYMRKPGALVGALSY